MAYTNVLRHNYRFIYDKIDSVIGNKQLRDYTVLRSGSSVSAWKDKIQKGLNATSTYSTNASVIDKFIVGARTIKYVQNSAPNVIITKTFEGFHGLTTFADPAHIVSTNLTSLENDALSKVIKKVKSTRVSLNGQSVLGELTKTLHGLRHPFELARSQVYAHLTTLNKRKRDIMRMPATKRKKAWREVVAGTWLEFNFGMKPVISDARAIAEALGRFQFDEPVRTRLRSKAEGLDKQLLQVDNLGNPFTLLAFKVIGERETKSFCTYSVGYEQVIRPAGSVDRLREVLGFNLENFVPALWEVMPWSWLIDYFTNMGEIVEAGTFNTEGVKWISKSVGRKTTETWLSVPEDARARQYATSIAATIKSISGTTHLGGLTQSKATYDRTNPATLGVPSLNFSIPGRGMQWANMTAILAQLSGRTYDSELSRKLMAKYPIARVRNRGVRSASDFLN